MAKITNTYTWLKVFVPALLLEILIFLMISNSGSSGHIFFSPLAAEVALVVSLLGLGIGLLINAVTKFRFALSLYILGHILSIVVSLVFSEVYLGPRSNDIELLPAIGDTITSNLFEDNDKHAIEEVIFLMEQQYPFGAYDIIDIRTDHRDNDSSAIYCSIVFTLTEEGNKKYISQYIVKNASIEAVYTKQDTTSNEYHAYELRSKAR